MFTDMLARCTVGLTCKTFVKLGLCSFAVDGLPTLLRALDGPREGQGILTVSNHISVLDDPLMWAVLPVRNYVASHKTRWTLGASDILFTNPIFSAFFRSGQVIETFRGDGVYQPSVDVAIEKLNRGAWIHLFPEGKVNQTHIIKEGVPRLSRFKWGIGRILMESTSPPIIIPIWLSGFDTLMPEGRIAPYKYIPRPFRSLRVSFGDPISADNIRSGLIECAKRATTAPFATEVYSSSPGPDGGKSETRTIPIAPWISEEIRRAGLLLDPPETDDTDHDGVVHRGDDRYHLNWHRRHHISNLDVDKLRSEITALIQCHVERLGKDVSSRSDRSDVCP